MVLDTCALPYGDARGIRVGTAAVTSQGMDDADMVRIAALFGAAVREEGSPARLRAQVRELAEGNPPYPG